jgi:hypothetical protein
MITELYRWLQHLRFLNRIVTLTYSTDTDEVVVIEPVLFLGLSVGTRGKVMAVVRRKNSRNQFCCPVEAIEEFHD